MIITTCYRITEESLKDRFNIVRKNTTNPLQSSSNASVSKKISTTTPPISKPTPENTLTTDSRSARIVDVTEAVDLSSFSTLDISKKLIESKAKSQNIVGKRSFNDMMSDNTVNQDKTKLTSTKHTSHNNNMDSHQTSTLYKNDNNDTTKTKSIGQSPNKKPRITGT